MSAVMEETSVMDDINEAPVPLALEASRLVRPDHGEDADPLWASRIVWHMAGTATVRDCLDGASCYLSTALGTFDREENMANCDHAGVVLVNLAAQMVSSAHSKLMAYDRDNGRLAGRTGAPASSDRIDEGVLVHRAALLDAFLHLATDGIADEARARYLNDERIAGSESEFTTLVRDLSDFVHEAAANYNLSYGHAWGIVDRIADVDDAREKLLSEFGLLDYPITNPVARLGELSAHVDQLLASKASSSMDKSDQSKHTPSTVSLTGLPFDVIPQFATTEDGIEAVHSLLQQINAMMQQETDSFSQPLWSVLQLLDLALGVQEKVMERMPRRVAA